MRKTPWFCTIALPILIASAPAAAIEDHPLIAVWTGTYEWDCGNELEGSSDLTMEITTVGPYGRIDGTVTYLDDSAALSGIACEAVLEEDYGFRDWCDGSPDADGTFLILQTPGSDNFVYNQFSGKISENGDAITGTTMNGDSSAHSGSSGCSAQAGPAGAFAVTTDRITEPQTLSDCLDGNWSEFGFNNQGRCIQQLRTGKDSR